MTGVDAGVNLYAGRTNEGRFFPPKKPRVASFVSGVSKTKIPTTGLQFHTLWAMTGPVIRLISVCQTPSFLSIILDVLSIPEPPAP